MSSSNLRATLHKDSIHQLHSRLEGQSAVETIPRVAWLTPALVGSGASHLQYHQGVQMLRGRMRILAAA